MELHNIFSALDLTREIKKNPWQRANTKLKITNETKKGIAKHKKIKRKMAKRSRVLNRT